MDFIKENWIIVLGGLLVVLFLFSKRNNGQGSITQIGGSGSDTAALASIASNERESDENRKFGFISKLLDYDLSLKNLNFQNALENRNLDQRLDLARISADANARAADNEFRLAQLSYNTQLQMANQQNALQQYYYQKAFGQQRRNDWLGAISGGLQSILPMIFGNSTSGGSMNFPRTPPIFNGG